MASKQDSAKFEKSEPADYASNMQWVVDYRYRAVHKVAGGSKTPPKPSKIHSTKFENNKPVHFAAGGDMQWVKEKREFTTSEFSIDETIQEAMDVIDIAKSLACDVKNSPRAIDSIIPNLKEIEYYLRHICKKATIALKYVPADVQESEFSTDETTDAVDIAKSLMHDVKNSPGDTDSIIQKFNKIEHYLRTIRKKVDVALKYVPDDVQASEHL